MRQFVVSEAPASRVAQHVREVVEEAGGIVAHHTAHKTEFDHVDYGEQAWRRAGSVGTYQRFKEKPVQVRIRVWAQWPRRLLTGTIYVGFTIALLFFALSILEAAIPPNAWIFTALPLFAVIAAALLMYTSSMADSRGAEEHIETLLVERLRADEQIPGEIYDVEDWEAYRERVVDEAREEARQRAPHGGSRVKRAAASLKGSLPAIGTSGGKAPPEADPAEVADDAAAPAAEGPGGDDDDEPTPDDEPGVLADLKAKLGLGDEGEAGDGEGQDPAGEDEGTGEAEEPEADARPGGGRA